MSIDERIQNIRLRIQAALERAGRPSHAARLIGVSKKQAVEKVLLAIQGGLMDFGENYVQEWQEKNRTILEKCPELSSKVHWHFIGHLQSNKAKDIVGKVDFIHTLDRMKLARKVSETAREAGLSQKVLIEVNLGGESTKSGYTPEDLIQALTQLATLPNLEWKGLMAIPPPTEDPEEARPYFRQLKSLLDECNQSGVLKEPLTELSMGMSHDFEVAIEEGATMVRIGTALFGPRI